MNKQIQLVGLANYNHGNPEEAAVVSKVLPGRRHSGCHDREKTLDTT
jgi:hypothetical protein